MFGPFPLLLVGQLPARRDLPRVPFGSLVERGLVPPGTRVTDRQRRVSAVVSPDGTLVSGTRRGSIHQIGAALTNAPSCNGWTFWHLERDGVLVALDLVRSESILVADGEAV